MASANILGHSFHPHPVDHQRAGAGKAEFGEVPRGKQRGQFIRRARLKFNGVFRSLAPHEQSHFDPCRGNAQLRFCRFGQARAQLLDRRLNAWFQCQPEPALAHRAFAGEAHAIG